ncbi:MAG: hypothetical protein ACT6Q3_11700, partial [Sphingopyxis sp.]
MTFHPTRRAVLAGLGLAPLAAASAADAPPATLLIRNVQLFDGTGSGRQPRNIRITGNRIDAVSAGDIPVPPGATLIDGAGQTLM